MKKMMLLALTAWGDHQRGGPIIGTGHLFGFRPQSWPRSLLSRLR